MSLGDAQSLITGGALFGDVFPFLDTAQQSVFKDWFLHEPGLPNLAARVKQSAPPIPSGDMCSKCGGHMVRTGTCMTCSSCGESSGGCG